MRIPRVSALAIMLLACSVDSPPEEVVAADRPAEWAIPMAPTPGLTNFFKVSDQLYRGAQPDDEGFFELKRLGIRTVVNLRSLHSDRDECEDAGLRYVHITAQAWDGDDDEVVEFLRVVSNPDYQPVFVHCQHGADRTGVMSAVYRIIIQGWSKDDAIREMTQGGFGFHGIWVNLVDYVRDLDVDRIKWLSGLDGISHDGGGLS